MTDHLDELRRTAGKARGELRQLAEEARRLVEEQRQMETVQAKAEAEYQLQLQELKAGYIIAQIMDRAKREAQAGRNHAIVMSVGSGDYDRPTGSWGICKPQWLTGACKIVYEYCRNTGFEPTLDSWHDGVGVNGGFNIVIHW